MFLIKILESLSTSEPNIILASMIRPTSSHHHSLSINLKEREKLRLDEAMESCYQETSNRKGRDMKRRHVNKSKGVVRELVEGVS